MFASRTKYEPLILTGSFVQTSIVNGSGLPFLYLYITGHQSMHQQYYELNTDVLDEVRLFVLDKDLKPAKTVKSVSVVLRFEESY